MDGKWTAEFGIIDAHGNYEAPPYVPAGGDDTITFTHGDNRRVPVLKARSAFAYAAATPGRL